MKYLTGEEILVIHSEIIDATGGSHGVRDAGLFLSIIERPKSKFGGKELFQGIFGKAAAYLESLVQYRVFIDGNKRTAFVACARFLYLNGFEFKATNKEVENFVLEVVVEKLDLKTIAAWFKKHSKRLKNKGK